MRKGKLAGLSAILMGLAIWCMPMEANAEEYAYIPTEVSDGDETVMVGKWYQGSYPDRVELEGMPAEVTYEDCIKIEMLPDEGCSDWLKGLTGAVGDITIGIESDEQFQIGMPDGELSIYAITNNCGIVTVYGDIDMLSAGNNDSRNGGGTTIVHGDVGTLYLGMRDESYTSGGMLGNITVNGNVGYVSWVSSLKSESLPDVYYHGYGGDVTVTGTVQSGTIETVAYDETVECDTWHTTGEIGECAAGTFVIEAGVLSEGVNVREIDPVLGNYYLEYQCYYQAGNEEEESKNNWRYVAYNKDTDEAAFIKDCTIEDVLDDSIVQIFGAKEGTTLDIDMKELLIFTNRDYDGNPVDLTVGGNVKELYIENGGKGKYDISINGNVENMSATYRYNPNYNLTVTGTVSSGDYSVRRQNEHFTMGYFATENKDIIINGDWNPEIFMYTSREDSAPAYQPLQKEDVDDALSESNVGETVAVETEDGNKNLVKEAEVLIQQTEENALEELQQEMEDHDLIFAVDIDVNTFYTDEETGDIYVSEDYGYEQVTELGEEKELDFTVKIPHNQYEEDVEYVLIREHWDRDGRRERDILPVRREGDRLSFSSDKFSTFMVVKQDEGDTVSELEVGDTSTVNISTPGEEVWFQFTPAETGYYAIKFSAEQVIGIALYDAEFSYLNGNNSTQDNFRNKLEAGQTYYYKFEMADANPDATGQFDFTFNRTLSVTGIEMVQQPDQTQFTYPEEYSSLDGFRLQLTLENGEVVEATVWDEIWETYGVDYYEQAQNGGDTQYDEEWRLFPGEYQWVVFVDDLEDRITIPFTVVMPSVEVKFDAQGGSACSSVEKEIGKAYGALPTPTKKGYTFNGWYTATTGGTKITSASMVEETESITLYARWTVNKYTIKYSLNGGKNAGNPTSYTVETKTITLKNPTRKGYTFAGWYKDSKLTKKVSKIQKGSTGNITLYAKWVLNKYTIKYNLNGGKNANNPTSYTVESNSITLKNPTKKGYTFAGWYQESKLTRKVTAIQKGSTENVTLYAKWTANKYTIKFNKNGGTGNVKSVTATYGKNAKLPKNSFKREGYIFRGWNTMKNGKGKTYQAGKNVKNLVDKKNGSVTLYAKWEAKKYTITYNLNGGKNSTKNPKTYTVEKAVKLQNPTKKNFVFKGWYSDKKCTRKVTQIKKGTIGNIKVYAKWVAKNTKKVK